MGQIEERAEIDQKLKDGYATLQAWWQGLTDLLPEPPLLVLIASHNSRTLGGLPLKYPETSTPIDISLYNHRSQHPLVHNLEFGHSYNLWITSLVSGRKHLEITPANKVTHQRERTSKNGGTFKQPYEIIPSDFPYYMVGIMTTPDLGEMIGLFIRFNARQNRSTLLTTLIDLDPTTCSIRNVHQTAKDGAFFPQPEPGRSKYPRQNFTFSIENGEPSYRFNYEVAHLNVKRNYARAEAELKSFKPYSSFCLPLAIERACNFEPVVTPPAR